jgi:homocysteine S-methyltransferase
MTEKKLPNDANGLFLTDSGLETSLIFNDGMELTHFASFVLLKTAEGRSRLKRYFAHHAEVAAAHGAGFVWESVTWRASRDWGDKLGYSARLLTEANRESIELMREVAAGFRTTNIFSGNIGPRGDGYVANAAMSADAASDYHARQIEVLAKAECDLVSAFTMTHTAEAIGIVRAAIQHGMDCAVSFTVETDGRLPSGEGLAEAIARTDTETGGHPAYYMINCAHPSHFAGVLERGGAWMERIAGVRANASARSHQELDDSPDLDAGDPVALGGDYARLLAAVPSLRVLGGCCGTDIRHVAEIAKACFPAARRAA